MPEGHSITVIFISDGQDNNTRTLEERMKKLKGNTNLKINFLCLGVGKGFPTFISMRLREKYHNGDEQIPAIFMIEYVSEKAYTIKFELLKNYFSFNVERQIKPSVQLFPWRELTDKVFETQWIMTDQKEISVDDTKVDVTPFNLNFDGISNIFRAWS